MIEKKKEPNNVDRNANFDVSNINIDNRDGYILHHQIRISSYFISHVPQPSDVDFSDRSYRRRRVFSHLLEFQET